MCVDRDSRRRRGDAAGPPVRRALFVDGHLPAMSGTAACRPPASTLSLNVRARSECAPAGMRRSIPTSTRRLCRHHLPLRPGRLSRRDRALARAVVGLKVGLIAFEAATVAALSGAPLSSKACRPPACGLCLDPLPVWRSPAVPMLDAAMCALLNGGLLLFLRAAFSWRALPSRWEHWSSRPPCWLAGLVAAVELAVAVGRRAHGCARLPAHLSVGRGVFGYLWGYVARRPGVRPPASTSCGSWSDLPGPCRLPVRSTPSSRGGCPVRSRHCRRLPQDARSYSHRGARLADRDVPHLAPALSLVFLALVPFLALTPSATAWALDARLSAPLRQRRRRRVGRIRHRIASSWWRPLCPRARRVAPAP